MSGPRILAIMGSGETGPTMAKVHRALFDLLERDAPATILDTPYGFQENADEISRRTVDYFRTSVGRTVGVATYRAADLPTIVTATAVARIAAASLVLAGPGSPSYALRQWAGGPIPEALVAKVLGGGILTMASAAALTLGIATIPVYEIYKVGAAPSWLDGLDLLGRATGLRAAVVPHYDNAEGGTHDTRFCYIGERRLRVLERDLPEGAFILGVDSHTALILDLERGSARVAGLGGVTVRVAGRNTVFPRGTETQIAAFEAAAMELRGGSGSTDVPTIPSGPASLSDAVARHEAATAEALAGGEVGGVVAGLLDLDELIERRIRTGEDSAEIDISRTTFRALLVRLGDLAGQPGPSPDDILPLVRTLVELRSRARSADDWATADLIRSSLLEAGVEVHDAPAGSTWTIRGSGRR
ncbi:MAG: type 1 glutamine amidotransferase family protein [Candidatus Limnocylindrales bacterium]